MQILTISGSSGNDSSNAKLLDALPALYPQQYIYRYKTIDQLPLFLASDDHHPWPDEVLKWRAAVAAADAVIISTPEYIHNLPALLKNALEWLTSSGELSQKPVLPITFAPHPPRGAKAMQSLVWSLQALDTRIIAELPLYQNEISFDESGSLIATEGLDLLRAGLEELGVK